MSNLTTDQMAEIIIRSTREPAKEFARKRRKIDGNGKRTETPSHNVPRRR
jgi:hypothetical protein